jgi:hypothetical protein
MRDRTLASPTRLICLKLYLVRYSFPDDIAQVRGAIVSVHTNAGTELRDMSKSIHVMALP